MARSNKYKNEETKGQVAEKKPTKNPFKKFGRWFGRRPIWQKIILIILLIAVVAGGIFSAFVYSKLDKINRTDLKATKKELSWVDVNGYVNILLLGVDSRDMKDSKGSRTDCIMIASINEKTGDVYLTSIYRDTFLKMGKSDDYDKITHAYAFGGAKEAITSINQALDLNIEKYVVFNFKAVSDVVDELGGLEFDIKDFEIDELNKFTVSSAQTIGKTDYKLVEKPGKQVLDGAQIVSYGRIRVGVGDEPMRTKRSRAVVEKLMEKIKGESVSKLNSLLNKILPEINTNLSNSDIIALGMDLPRNKLVGSKSFPYNLEGALMNGVYYSFPTDLAKDVKELHKIVFGQDDYKVTPLCQEISDKATHYLAYGVEYSKSIDQQAFEENPTEQEPLPVEENKDKDKEETDKELDKQNPEEKDKQTKPGQSIGGMGTQGGTVEKPKDNNSQDSTIYNPGGKQDNAPKPPANNQEQ